MSYTWPPRYFDRQGEPITTLRFGELHEDMDYKRVALDVYPARRWMFIRRWRIRGTRWRLGPLARVSTVWLGLNHRFAPGPPLIFETMIFGSKYDQACERYCTEDDAVRGHRRTMEDLRAGRVPWFLAGDVETSSNGEE